LCTLSESRYDFNCMLNETANDYMHPEHKRPALTTEYLEKKPKNKRPTQIQNQLSCRWQWGGTLCGSYFSSSVWFCRRGKSSSLGWQPWCTLHRKYVRKLWSTGRPMHPCR